MVWGCFATSGQETFGAIEATTNLKLYEEILQENVGGEVYEILDYATSQ